MFAMNIGPDGVRIASVAGMEARDLDYPVDSARFDFDAALQAYVGLYQVAVGVLGKNAPAVLDLGTPAHIAHLLPDSMAEIGKRAQEVSVKNTLETQKELVKQGIQDPDWLEQWRYRQYRFEMGKNIGPIVAQSYFETMAHTIVDQALAGKVRVKEAAKQSGKVAISGLAAIGAFKLMSQNPGANLPPRLLISGNAAVTVNYILDTNFDFVRKTPNQRTVSKLKKAYMSEPQMAAVLPRLATAVPSFGPQDPFYTGKAK